MNESWKGNISILLNESNEGNTSRFWNESKSELYQACRMNHGESNINPTE
jgi:hypothetical protein